MLGLMDRIPEPELMDDPAQALAYARADFEQPHSQFIEHFRRCFPDWSGAGYVLDLGCGPGDICRRFARAYPRTRVHGVDGAPAMLAIGRADLHATELADRVELIKGYLPGAVLPRRQYDAVISNSLLHHLHEPQALWQSIVRHTAPGAPVFVMDLRRPDSPEQAAHLVGLYAAQESEVLREDFRHSLRAAYRPEEVILQLHAAGIHWLSTAALGDRHLIVHGHHP